MSSFLQVRDLRVGFEAKDVSVEAVRGISFDIRAGETLGLVGESGSGKSVTALSLMRLIPDPPGKIKDGKVLLEGKDLLSLPEGRMRKIRGNRLSMIFQEPMTSLNPVFTAGYQIDEALILHQNMTKKEARRRTIELLGQVGIVNPSERVNAYPHELSGGQRQRVMIAMAIACQPDLLIADEPTTALDVTIQKQILELLRELQSRMKMSMLFISHDLGIIAEIAQRVLVMYKGEIVEEGKAADIFKNPAHPYTKGLIACRPTLDVTADRLPMVSDFLKEEPPRESGPGNGGRGGRPAEAGAPRKRAAKQQTADSGPSAGGRESPRLQNSAAPPAAGHGGALLAVQGLKKHFPLKKNFFGKAKSWIKAVDGVSFEVSRGSVLGLVGESGCGKTTLGRAVLRLTEPSAGSVFYNKEDILSLDKKKMKAMRRKMQIIFQDPYASLNPRMTICSSIMEPMLIHSLWSGKEERISKVEELMGQVGLDPGMKSRYPHEFSGGQRQRICIARALAVQPEFIVCDESVSSLDVSIQAQILNLLKDLQDNLNLSYIFISHDLTVVKFISDNVAVMHEGKVVEMNSSEEIYRNPRHPYTKKLIDAIPSGIPKDFH